MAAFFTGRKARCDGNHDEPITRDFLGGSFGIESTKFDLNSQVLPGWVKCLNLETGKLYIKRVAPFVDQAHPPCSKAQPKPSLDLALGPDFAAKTPSDGIVILENDTHRGANTVDDVRSALKRISTSLGSASKKRLSIAGSGSTSSSIESISNPFGDVCVAGSCHSCLMYVVVLKKDPKCPKCGKVVLMVKNFGANLNVSI